MFLKAAVILNLVEIEVCKYLNQKLIRVYKF
jgi:hypothetical protein